MSFRARVLLLVLAIVLPALGLVGVWLTRSVTASADRALLERLSRTAERSAADVAHRWAGVRGPLLSLIDDSAVQRALSSGDVPDDAARARLDGFYDDRAPAILGLRLTSARDAVLWERGDSARPGSLPIRIPAYRPADGARLGTLAVWLESAALFTGGSGLSARGALVSALDPATGGAVLALPFDADALQGGRFTWGGEEWLLVRRPLAEPRLDLLAAAPRGAEAAALRTATREGLLLLLLLGSAALAVAWAWSSRLTRSLRDLAGAADAVADGDLDVSVHGSGGGEVARVAAAFNRMAGRLKETLSRLADREALAAVGQMSAELAHDIRNPLTAMRLELGFVQERLTADSPLHEAQTAALAELDRLDATVNSTLLLSRTGTLRFEPLPLATVLEAAARTARAAFDSAGATLEVSAPPTTVHVAGDAAALERLFQNLLFNAADALVAGGRATVSVRPLGETVDVFVDDDGHGIPPEALPRVFEPRFTTKRGGSGLGLAIAERIARAHGGTVAVQARDGGGTRFQVSLPLSAAVTDGPDPSQNVAAEHTAKPATFSATSYRSTT